MTEVKTKIDRLRDEYVMAVGAVQQAERMIVLAQEAYDAACERRNDAQATFIQAGLAAPPRNRPPASAQPSES